MKADRFRQVCKLLASKVNQSGETAVAYNEITKEVAVLHWSLDTSIGKRYVMANTFTKYLGPTRKGSIPVYDFYNAGFAGCDQFNRRMHDKTWPFDTRRTKMGTDIVNGWDYLFTTIVLNTWHLWINADLDRMPVRFNNFCQALASSLVTSRIPSTYVAELVQGDEGDENVNNTNCDPMEVDQGQATD